MNRWIKNIALWLALDLTIFLFSCGPSVDENEGKERINIDSVSKTREKIDMEKDSLSFYNIKAFEQRAIQKLEDLKDYFEILSNPKIDEAFKNQANVMARELFASGENTVTVRLVENQKDTLQNSDSFFTSLKNGDFGKISFEIHNISLIKNINHLNDAEYVGAIKFKLYVSENQENGVKTEKRIDMQCDIIAKKVQKKFGKETKLVWEVFLGDIFQIP